MSPTEHKLLCHVQELEIHLKATRKELERLKADLDEMEEEKYRVLFRHGAVLAEIAAKQKQDDASRN